MEQNKIDKPFVMPDADVAWPVLWYSNANDSTMPFPAVVRAVGGNTLDLVVFGNSATNMVKIGCMHKDDPRHKTVESQREGAWDHTPLVKLLLKIIARHDDSEDLFDEPDALYFFSATKKRREAVAKAERLAKEAEEAKKAVEAEDELPVTAQV